MTAQLDIFEGTEFTVLHDEMKKTKELSEKTRETSENVRKGIFARFSTFKEEVLNKITEQQKEIDYLKELVKEKT